MAAIHVSWVERVEGALGDEETLRALVPEVEDAGLDERERDDVLGRIDRYLESFDDVRQANLLVAVDEVLAGTRDPESVPDFDLGYGIEDPAYIAEGRFEERMHPRDRLGRWRDVPDLPNVPKVDLFAGSAFKRVYDGFSHNGIEAVVIEEITTEGTKGVLGLLLHQPDDGGGPVTVGTFEHSLYNEEGRTVVFRDLIRIDPAFHNRGFATAFYTHEERQLAEAGVDRVELSASLETGAYTWARVGFEFREGDGDLHPVRDLWAMYGWPSDRSDGAEQSDAFWEADVGRDRADYVRALRARVGEEEWQRFADRFPTFEEAQGPLPEDKFTQPFEIAMYGSDGPRWEQDGHSMWIGKAFLLGAGWEGQKRLNPPMQEAATQDASEAVQQVADSWRRAGRLHDAPDDIRGDDDDAFWEQVRVVLGVSTLAEARRGEFNPRLHPRNRLGRWIEKLRSSSVLPADAMAALTKIAEKAHENLTAEDVVSIVTNLETVISALTRLVASADDDVRPDLQEALTEARSFEERLHPRNRLGEWIDKPELLSRLEFDRANPSYAWGVSRERAQRFDALPDDARVWLYHATSYEDTARAMARDGIDPTGKPRSLARERYESGEHAVYQPGAGVGDGLYVGYDPRDVSGYGRWIVAVQVRKGDVVAPPEQKDATPGQALSVGDAMVRAPIPPERVRLIGDAARGVPVRDQREPKHPHDEFVKAAGVRSEGVTRDVVPLSQVIYIAEGAMARAGQDGGPFNSRIGHRDDPEQQAEEARLSEMARAISGDETLRVIVTDWITGSSGKEGHAYYNRMSHTIGIRPASTKLTFLHEIAHAMTRTTHEEGHTPEFARQARDLYAKHISPEAAEVFWNLVGTRLEPVRSEGVIPTRTYRVAGNFYSDHVSRGFDQGKVVRQSKSFTEVELDRESYDELLADAHYYAEEMNDPENVDADTRAVSKSAERVVAKLTADGAPDPLPPEEVARRAAAREDQRVADEQRAAEMRAQAQERAASDAARRAREDKIEFRLLVRVENANREIDGVTPADATRILNERKARAR